MLGLAELLILVAGVAVLDDNGVEVLGSELDRGCCRHPRHCQRAHMLYLETENIKQNTAHILLQIRGYPQIK